MATTKQKTEEYILIKEIVYLPSVLMFRNSLIRSENAVISVGQTNVLELMEMVTIIQLFHLQIQWIEEENEIFVFEIT